MTDKEFLTLKVGDQVTVTWTNTAPSNLINKTFDGIIKSKNRAGNVFNIEFAEKYRVQHGWDHITIKNHNSCYIVELLFTKIEEEYLKLD